MGWTSSKILVALVISAVSFVAFAAIERRAAHPMLPLRFFRQRDFTGSVVSLGIVFFAGIVLFFFLSQYWQLVQGRSPLRAGLMAVPNAAAIITGSGVAQSLLAKVGPRRIVSTAMIIMGTGVALFTTVDIGTSTLRMVGTLMVVGFGFGLAAQPLTDTVMAAVPVEDAGIGSAVNDVSRELGSALGVAIIGSIVSHLYRNNVHHTLSGHVPARVVDLASEGIGVIHVAANSIQPALAAKVIDNANHAFVDAMTTGFWISVGFIAIGLATSLLLLPKRSRVAQMVRIDDDGLNAALATAAPATFNTLDAAGVE